MILFQKDKKVQGALTKLYEDLINIVESHSSNLRSEQIFDDIIPEEEQLER